MTTLILDGYIVKEKNEIGKMANSIGLVLSPNRIVPDCFELGDEIEILKNEE